MTQLKITTKIIIGFTVLTFIIISMGLAGYLGVA
jgi:hypothetical protein